ncbi:MAG: hypothetical protein ACTSXL_02460 [Alphaproteobacteria bacterium]
MTRPQGAGDRPSLFCKTKSHQIDKAVIPAKAGISLNRYSKFSKNYSLCSNLS